MQHRNSYRSFVLESVSLPAFSGHIQFGVARTHGELGGWEMV
jgi:hypothetical protein